MLKNKLFSTKLIIYHRICFRSYIHLWISKIQFFFNIHIYRMYICLSIFFENLNLFRQIVLEIWSYLKNLNLATKTLNAFFSKHVFRFGEENFSETARPIDTKFKIFARYTYIYLSAGDWGKKFWQCFRFFNPLWSVSFVTKNYVLFGSRHFVKSQKFD